MSLQNRIQIVYRKEIFTNCKVVWIWVELNAMNGTFLLKFLYNFVHSLIDHIDSTFFSSRNNVIALTWKTVDIVAVNVLYLMLQRTNPQIPNPNLFVLAST
jgi:hypothetical protein